MRIPFILDKMIPKKHLHELYLAKKELDEYPLSQQYQKAYYAVRRLYAELDEILFGPYQYHLSCGGKPHA